ncbi:MAG: hypothetical protein Q8R76_03655 [Candidatus Omnitrophota bacterium]|nr:hypothetical protein [Candidatus Omnitrophota bacterium]
MATQDIVFYIGTRRIACFIGQVEDGRPQVLRYKDCINPQGFEGGLVTNLEDACQSIESLIESVGCPRPSGELRAHVVLGNAKLKTYTFTSSQYYNGQRRSITSHEVRACIEQTKSVATLPLSEYVLQAVPESFLVNDMADVRNPLALEAVRLGVNLKIFTMEFHHYRNLSKSFEMLDIDVLGYFPKNLVQSEAVLTDQEKQEGTLFVDVVDDMTHLVLWKNGYLSGSRYIPIGGHELTKSIAEQWQIGVHDARRVKEQFAGYEVPKGFEQELIPLVDRNGKTNRSVTRQEFSVQFLMQAKDWMGKIMAEAESFARDEKLFYPHYVFTGGPVSPQGALEFIHREFECEARLGQVRKVEAPHELLVDTALGGGLGMYYWLAYCAPDNERLLESRGVLEKTLSSARDWLYTYF